MVVALFAAARWLPGVMVSASLVLAVLMLSWLRGVIPLTVDRATAGVANG